MGSKRDKLGRFVKGSHSAVGTEFKKGEHTSSKTEFRIGCVPWNKGKKGCFSKETVAVMREKAIQRITEGQILYKNTSIEIALQKELDKTNLKYETHVPLCKVAVVDIFLREYNVIVQADGDYWHNLHKVKERDINQDKILKKDGYKVFRFWEHEINKDSRECIQKVQDFISLQGEV